MAEAASFALARHMSRAQAQELVARACRTAADGGGHLLDVLARQTDAPVDWLALQAPEALLGQAPALVDRGLAQLAADERPR